MQIKFLFIALPLVIMSCQTKFLYDDQGANTQILKVLETQQLAWNEGNLDQFMEGYWQNDEMRFVGNRGITKGYNNALLNYRKGYPDVATMGQLNFDIYEVKMLSKRSAHVVGRYTLTRLKDKPTGVFTLLFQKIKGEWKIILDHTGS